MSTVKTSNNKFIGGYFNLTRNIKALIAESTDNDDYSPLVFFYPINDHKKLVVFPCMEVSDKTLNGFKNAADGEEFIGFKNAKMKRMTQTEFESYLDYTESVDPSDMPDGW